MKCDPTSVRISRSSRLRMLAGSLGSLLVSRLLPQSSSSPSSEPSASRSSTRSSASLPLPPDDRDWPEWALKPADPSQSYTCHFCGPAWRVKWSPVDRYGDTILAYYRHLSRHGTAATVEALERSIFENMIKREGLA